MDNLLHNLPQVNQEAAQFPQLHATPPLTLVNFELPFFKERQWRFFFAYRDVGAIRREQAAEA